MSTETKTADEHVSFRLQLEKLTTLYEEAIRGVAVQVDSRFPGLSTNDRLQAVVTAVENVLEVSWEHFLSKAKETENEKKVGDKKEASGKKEKKIVRAYLDGCFDIMHSGHYNAIRQAKMIADVLVVGVHSDAEITRNKGPPVMNEEERLATVKACKWVDEVVFDTPYDPSLALLDKLNCDFVCHGDDMPVTADGKDAYKEVREAGRLRIIKRTEGVSTTDIVGRLLLMTRTHMTPAVEPATSSSPVLTSIATSQTLSRLSLGARVKAPTEEAGASSSDSSSKRQKVDTPPDDHYAKGITAFLPTTWRISQFSNNRAPLPTDKVAYIDGAFDLFHIGHIETLKQARSFGTFLYVGIHDDTTVNQHKGRNYPIMNLHERVLNVLSCKYVDEVVIGAPWEVTKDLVKVLNITVVVSGSNSKMDREEELDPYAFPKSAGIFQIVESNSLHTKNLIDRIVDNRLKYEKRNANREKKELAYLENRTYVQEL